MTYRERRERRAERLRGWAEKRQQRSAAAFKSAKTLADSIPLGQPILIGHHSEKRARRDQERIHNGMRAGVEHENKAHSMASRAAEIDRQAEAAIYSDDVDALERMRERLQELEAKRDRLKLCNKAIRKHGLAELLKPGTPFELTEDEKRELLKLMQICPYHQVEKKGFPAYALSNLAGNITRNRGRLAELERRAAQRARVEAVLIADAAETGDMITERDFDGEGRPTPAPASWPTDYCLWRVDCPNTPTGTTPAGHLGELPTCDDCHRLATGKART